MRREIYQSRFTGEQADAILEDVLISPRLSQEEYDALKTAGQLRPGVFYRIYSDAAKTNLVAMYDGEQLLINPSTLVEGALFGKQLTQDEYDALKDAGQIEYGKIYRIYGDYRFQRLLAIYDGTTLVAQRDTSRRKGFPYAFPIVFS